MLKFAKLIANLFLAFSVVAINIIIATCTAGIIELQLLGIGYTKWLSFSLSAAFALIIFFYILYNHKIINYLYKGKTNEQDSNSA